VKIYNQTWDKFLSEFIAECKKKIPDTALVKIMEKFEKEIEFLLTEMGKYYPIFYENFPMIFPVWD